MKIKVTAGPPAPPTYPFLGISSNGNGLIVLFSAAGQGIVLQTNTSWRTLGEYHAYWAMDTFLPFTGTVELSA